MTKYKKGFIQSPKSSHMISEAGDLKVGENVPKRLTCLIPV
jgi:hypothetical protein